MKKLKIAEPCKEIPQPCKKSRHKHPENLPLNIPWLPNTALRERLLTPSTEARLHSSPMTDKGLCFGTTIAQSPQF
jgi:hypothetical protein